MKKLFALILTLALALGCAALASAEEAAISEGIFDGSFSAGDYGMMTNFIHFYPADEHTGRAIFYYSAANGQMITAGYYTVEDVETAYNSYANHDDKGSQVNQLEGTAPKMVQLTSLEGDILGQVAYDPAEGILYAMNLSGINSGMLGYNYVQDTASEHTAADEVGITIEKFASPEDETVFVDIYHNGTYGDYVVMQVLGTWTVDETGRVYTLTPEDEDDTAAILTVAEDGMTAVYVNEDGEEAALAKPVAALQVKLYAETDVDVGGGTMMHFYLNLDLYDDGTAELIQSYAADDTECTEGQIVSRGTWSTEGVIMDGELSTFGADASVTVGGFDFAIKQ